MTRIQVRPFSPTRQRGDDWREKAACADLFVDPEAFFPNDTDEKGIAAAKAICRECPVLQECRDWAIGAVGDYGIFGGLTGDERKKIRRNSTRKPQTSTRTVPINGREHGTNRGYHQHSQAKETACEDCKFAHALHEAARKERDESAITGN